MEPVRIVNGPVSVLDRADVDTDQIIPKQFLKRIERTGYGEFLFYDWAKEPGWDLPPNPILVAGRNFGSGSSREHAVWAIHQYGFRAVIAPSFADIFANNAAKNGLLTVTLPAEICQEIAAAGEAEVDLESCEVRYGDKSVEFQVPDDVRDRLLNGLDDISITLASADAIDAYERDRERQGPVTTAL
jgi:3-isopropylmalate/(R)-2-methylmalate dehydratase small subunit